MSKFRRKVAPVIDKLKELIYPLFLLITVLLILFAIPKITPFLEKAFIVPRFVWELVLNKEVELKKNDNAINILLLGIAGGNHEGAMLTDTIIFAHLNPQTNNVVLVSIPRDLWIPILQSKINAAYEFGQQKKPGGGLSLAKATVADILGQDIQYAFRVDFSGFIRAVDQLGGIDIDVERSFDDYNYPIPGEENNLCGKSQEETKIAIATISAASTARLFEVFPCRVERLHFDKGQTHMDGQTGLKYVRSRQSEGAEGTDFARSKRQQKLLVALKDKVFSAGVLLNPVKLISLYQTLNKSIDTDIKTWEFDDFIKLARKMEGAKIKTVVIDQGDEEKNRAGILVNPPASQYGAWVLVPRSGDFTEIQEHVRCEITTDNCPLK
ncbi:LCP family protein [Candidatus Microgenomates bacterium]|nr:LCP family protein [Candidatus Microgenomates bacterium]